MFWIDNAGFLSGGMDPVFYAYGPDGSVPYGANVAPVRIPHHHFDQDDTLVGYSSPQELVVPRTATRRRELVGTRPTPLGQS